MNKRPLCLTCVISLLLLAFFILTNCSTEEPGGGGGGSSEPPKDSTAPAEVGQLTATTGNGSVTFYWQEPADADFKAVEITFTPEVSGIEQPLSVVKGEQAVQIFSLMNGTNYAFKLQTVDNAGNRSTGTEIMAAPDGDAPTVQITYSGDTHIKQTTIPFTVSFSEEIKGFEAADILTGNCTISTFTEVDGQTYRVEATASTEGAVSLQVAAGGVLDLSGNGNLASSILNITYDKTLPTVVISADTTAATMVKGVNITVTFSEEVTGFEQNDLFITNATISSFTTTDNKQFTFSLTAAAEGEVTVDIKARAATDLAGNSSEAANIVNYNYDITAPTPVLSSTVQSPTNLPQVPFTVTFLEVVKGFEAADIIVTGGQAHGVTTTDSKTFTFEVTPAAANVSLFIKEKTLTDSAGNLNPKSNSFNFTFDSDKPTVSLTTTEQIPTNKGELSALVKFSEAVTGFTLEDITPVNCTIKSFTQTNSQEYSLLITPLVDGPVELSIAADSGFDSSGNGNSISNKLTILYDTTPPTAPKVSGELKTENNNLTWSWDIPADAVAFAYRLDSGQWQETIDTATVTFSPTVGLMVGSHKLEVKAKDIAGNWSLPGEFVTEVYIERPINVTISNKGNFGTALKWTSNTGLIVKYSVERKVGIDGIYQVVHTSPRANPYVGVYLEEDYNDKDVKEKTFYAYRIKNFNENGESSYSKEVSVMTPARPAPVENLRAVCMPGGEVHVTWNKMSDVASYRLYRKVGSAVFSSYMTEHFSPGEPLLFIDNGPAYGNTMSYRIVVTTSSGYSLPVDISLDVPARPQKASDLTAVVLPDKRVQLRWSDNATNEIGYVLFRAEANNPRGKVEQIANLPPDEISFVDTGAVQGQSYYYYLYAESSFVKSENIDSNKIFVPLEIDTLDKWYEVTRCRMPHSGSYEDKFPWFTFSIKPDLYYQIEVVDETGNPDKYKGYANFELYLGNKDRYSIVGKTSTNKSQVFYAKGKKIAYLKMFDGDDLTNKYAVRVRELNSINVIKQEGTNITGYSSQIDCGVTRPVDNFNDPLVYNLKLENPGSKPFRTSNLQFKFQRNTVYEFEIDKTSLPMEIAPGGSAILPIIYKPRSLGTHRNVLTISSSPLSREINNPYYAELNLIGECQDDIADITVKPDTGQYTYSSNFNLDFGTIRAGETKSIALTIGNKGNKTLSLTGNPLIVPAVIDGFSVDSTGLSNIINPQQSSGGRVVVTFTPTRKGRFSEKMTIPNNDPFNSSFQITLTGNSIAPEVFIKDRAGREASHNSTTNFGKVFVHVEAGYKEYTIENRGDMELKINSITLSDVRNFTLVPPANLTIQPGMSETFRVKVLAMDYPNISTDITILSNDPRNNNSYKYTLSAESINARYMDRLGVWYESELPTSQDVRWFYFSVKAGTRYHINWDEKAFGTGVYTGVIKISGMDKYFFGKFSGNDGGYYTPKEFVAQENGVIMIKVEAESSFNSSYAGTFAIKVTEQP